MTRGAPALFEALAEEWRSLSTDRVLAARLPDACQVAGDARTLGEVERYVQHAGPAVADEVLLAVVRVAITEGRAGELASRLLLQLLLPGTRNLARRWWALGDADERAAAAVAAVYGRIRNYPLDRRPGRVAANVLMDAAQDLRRSVPNADVTLVDPTGEWLSDPPGLVAPSPHPAVELSELLGDAVRAGVLGLADAQLIARTRIRGDRIEEIAETHDLTARTLWARRKRAERALVRAGPPALL